MKNYLTKVPFFFFGLFALSAGYLFAANLDRVKIELGNEHRTEMNSKKPDKNNKNSASTNNKNYYSNTLYNLSLTYPKDYIIYQQSDNFVQFAKREYKNIQGEMPFIMVIVRDNPKNFKASEWFDKNPELYVGNRSFDEVENSGVFETEVSNKKASSIIFKGLGEIQSIVMNHDSKIIEFTVQSLSGFKLDKELVEDYNSILNSYTGI